MLSTTLLTLALALPLPQDDKAKGPSAEQVKACIAALEAAFEQDTPDEITTALQGVSLVDHEDVVEVFEDEGLRHKDPGVRRAVTQALGMLRHGDALEALHKHYKRNKKKLSDDPEQFVPLLKAIALHQDESSIQVLVDDALSKSVEREVVQARVLGLARIRTNESLAELFDLMRKVDRRKVQNRMNDIRLALVVLTHVDQGTSQDRWIAWWNDNKKTFEVPKVVPKLPRELGNRWGNYWGEQRQYDRQKRRGDRGDDPEEDGGDRKKKRGGDGA